MSLRTLLKTYATAILPLSASLVASVPVRADTINITYSLTGMATVTGMTSTTLDLSGAFTGSVDQANPAKNALWNPVTYSDVSQANLSTGLLTGAFTITFANGEYCPVWWTKTFPRLLAHRPDGSVYTNAYFHGGNRRVRRR